MAAANKRLVQSNSRIGDKAINRLSSARSNTSSTRKAPTMNYVPPDTCLQDYKKRRSAFLKELISSTPNVSVRAKGCSGDGSTRTPLIAIMTKPKTKTWVGLPRSLDADWPKISVGADRHA